MYIFTPMNLSEGSNFKDIPHVGHRYSSIPFFGRVILISELSVSLLSNSDASSIEPSLFL